MASTPIHTTPSEGDTDASTREPVKDVAIGAPADGLTALRAFFAAFPPHPQFAVVLVTSLDPHRENRIGPWFSFARTCRITC